VKEDYEVAKTIADRNWDNIAGGMPSSLERKAERLFKSLSAGKGTLFQKLEKLYIFMDELYSFVGKFTPCKKGCSLCCYNEVFISLLEAEYIEKSRGITQSLNLDRKHFRGTPCPFLEDGACTIYNHRPFVCRRHVALFDNPKWCQFDVDDQYVFPQIRFSKVEESYAFIVVSSGDTSTYDIRQLFAKVS
jgi:Fe-S-cluster containining protein